MTYSPKIIAAAAAFGLCLAVSAVSAEEVSGVGQQDSSAMQNDMHHESNGSMHEMPATVTSADSKTGIVEVTTAGMPLRVHFPPASMADLKAGDQIKLHMGFTQ